MTNKSTAAEMLAVKAISERHYTVSAWAITIATGTLPSKPANVPPSPARNGMKEGSYARPGSSSLTSAGRS